MINIPLKKVPNNNWEIKFKEVMSDPFIQRKYDRNKRINDKVSYINKWTPEVMNGDGYIIDIGPGPGEYLELCRFFGNKIQGFDAKPDLSMMGNNYIKICQLMAERQDIPIIFDDFISILSNDEIIEEGSISLINSQGAIEQIFKKFIDFPEGINKEGWIPSHNGYWIYSDESQRSFNLMLEKFNRWLRYGGKVVIYANGSMNNEIFNKLLINAVNNIKDLKLSDRTDESKRIKIIWKRN